jgi:hypothetical protein
MRWQLLGLVPATAGERQLLAAKGWLGAVIVVVSEGPLRVGSGHWLGAITAEERGDGRTIADIVSGAANKISSPRLRESCSRPLPQLLNALLKSQGGWDVHSCKCSDYVDKRLPRLRVL